MDTIQISIICSSALLSLIAVLRVCYSSKCSRVQLGSCLDIHRETGQENTDINLSMSSTPHPVHNNIV